MEAAMSLLLRLLTVDESLFASVLEHAEDATVGCVDLMGRSLLHYAAMLGKASALALLLSRPVEGDLRDDRGDTALHLAAGNGERQAVELLLAHGVDRSLQDEDGRTALDLAHSEAQRYFQTEAVHALAL